jgi:hypothetical protein
MRRTFLFCLLVGILPLSLTGCVASVDTEVESEAPKRFARGYFSEVTSSEQARYDATHKLITEDGESLFVRSLIYDLSDSSYQDAIVAIRGVEREIADMVTLTIDDIQIEKVGLDPTTYDYMPYTNANLGIALRLPTIVSVENIDNGVEISGDPLNGTFTISRASLEDSGLPVGALVKLGDEQLDAVRLFSTDQGFAYAVSRKDTMLYELEYKTTEKNDLLISEKILQSFSFIPTAEDEIPNEDADNVVNDSDENDIEDVQTDSSVDEQSTSDESTVDAEAEVSTEDPVEESVDAEVALLDPNEIDLEEYRSLQSRPLKFTGNYPKNWYYSQIESGYAFSNEPVDSTNDWTAYIALDGNLDVVLPTDWINVTSGRFSVYGPESDIDILKVMLSTLESL